MLKAVKVSKNFGSFPAVSELSLGIPKGKLIAFLGPNGSGKSTTISMLTGLSKPSTGEIRFEGKSIDHSDYQKKIGVVFQNSVLDKELTVLENLNLRAGMYGNIKKNRVEELLTQFELEPNKNQRYETLSGGEKRRVDIARALIHEPKLLFLDEPSTGIDVHSRAAIWKLLNQMIAQKHITIFLTTHYLEEAEEAEIVYIIDHGKLVARGSASELKQKYTKNVLEVKPTDLADFLTKIPADLTYQRTADQINFPDIAISEALEILTRNKALIQSFDFHKGSMNEVFLNLTGRGFSK